MSPVFMITVLGIDPAHSAFRDSDKILLPYGSALPPFCLKCGNTPSKLPSQTLVWFPEPSRIPLILVGIVSYRKMTVYLPLCREHLWLRRLGKVCGVSLLLLAIPVGLALGELSFNGAGSAGFLAFLLTFIAGAVIIWNAEILHAKRMDDSGVVLKGASEEYLNHLPHAPCTPR